MISRLLLSVLNRTPVLRPVLWKLFFDILARATGGAGWWRFMNYGYADLGVPARLDLRPEDEAERYCIQLYDHLLRRVDLRGRDLLEVGCGRGGGVAYAARYFRPRRVAGLDIAPAAIGFCRRHHRLSGVDFTLGRAEDLPFPSDAFDVLVNVESSFCYTGMDLFLAEASRVLRPGGTLLFADLRHPDELADLGRAVADSGLEIRSSADITANVLRALDLDNERRAGTVRRRVPRPFHGIMNDFVGASGSRIPSGLRNGSLRYVSYTLRKPLDVEVAIPEKVAVPA